MAENNENQTPVMDQSQNPTSPYYIHPSDNPGMKLVNIKFDGTGYGDWKRSMLISLYEIKQGADSVSSYYTEIKMIWDQLDVVDPITSCKCAGCTCEITQKMIKSQEDRRLVEFLMKLNDGFEVIRGSILVMSPLPAISHAYRLLLQEENHKKLLHPVQSSEEVMAFAANRRNFNFRSQGGSGSNFRSQTGENRGKFNSYFCDHCKMTGHTAHRCYKLHGYPSHFKTDNRPDSIKVAANVNSETNESTNVSDNKNAGFTDAQYAQLLQLLGKDAGELSTKNNMKAACVAGKICLTSHTSVHWIVDSGATDHMCHDLSLFMQFSPIPNLETYITLPDGKKLLVSQIGDIQVTDSIILKDVLYVPDFRYNLVFIPKLCQDLKCSVTFTNDQCFLQSPSMTQMPLGNFKNGLYYLATNHISNDAKGFTAAISVEENQNKIKLWHLRMGHLPISMLHHLSNVFDKPCRLHTICQVCPKAKHTRVSFPHSSIKTDVACSMVHLDVWGPYKELTRDNYKYFFTIVDDFSRMTWVFLLKNKSEVFPVFCDFVLYIENQFKLSIHVVRTDNAPELSKGYSPGKKGYKVLNTKTLAASISRDVIFHEQHFPYHLKSCTDHSSKFQIFLPIVTLVTSFTEFTPIPDVFQLPAHDHDANSQDFDFHHSSHSDNNTHSSHTDENHFSHTDEFTSDNRVILRKSTRDVNPPLFLKDFICNHSTSTSTVNDHWCNIISSQHLSPQHHSFIAHTVSLKEPLTYEEAIRDNRWVEAMRKEIIALQENQTWELVSLPAGKKPVGSKWVYKIKLKADGNIERFKARLVAKGYNQKWGIDYEETFSPVVKMTTVRCLLALASHKLWQLHQLDINNAFLHGDLTEEVYMSPPQGFDCPKGYVCRLIKSLYGLKQASRQWFAKLLGELQLHGFTQSKNDYSLFIKRTNQCTTIAAVYVDDTIITGNDDTEIQALKVHLHATFSIKDLGLMSYFLGIEIGYLAEGITMSQAKFTKELLDEAASTAGQGILLQGADHLTLQAFTDSNWGACKDTRRSISGYVMLLGKSPISWKSKKQGIVSKSSAEAEYRAMSNAASEITWLVRLLAELGMLCLKPVTLHCDNQSSIHIAKNPVHHERTKHIEIDVHFTRDKVLEGLIQLSYVPTTHQLADVFTKVLPSVQFTELLAKLGTTQCHPRLRGHVTNMQYQENHNSSDNTHDVTKCQLSKGKDSLAAQGKRRYDRKQSGYGGQTKPVFHKKGFKHFKIGGDKKGKGTSLF
ncbi:hypothetical protein AgCh_017628 [Apium graveolens]